MESRLVRDESDTGPATKEACIGGVIESPQGASIPDALVIELVQE